jgi:hypothetical protein
MIITAAAIISSISISISYSMIVGRLVKPHRAQAC